MYWAAADVLSLAAQLSTARDLPPMDVLQRRIEGLLDKMGQKAKEANYADKDVADARYAIIAFIDEQILRSPWPGRTQWLAKPLQFVHYNENTAGEGFYVKMEELRGDPQRSDVLEVYFLCIALGFEGIYAIRGDREALSSLQEAAGAHVIRNLGITDAISPHGDPRDARRGVVRADAPLIALGIASLFVALIVFVVLRYNVSSAATQATTQMQSLPAVASAKPGAP